MSKLTIGQIRVLRLMAGGAVLKKVAGMGSYQAPRCYLSGGPVPKYKERRVSEAMFKALEIRGHIARKSGDGWMTSGWVISPSGIAEDVIYGK